MVRLMYKNMFFLIPCNFIVTHLSKLIITSTKELFYSPRDVSASYRYGFCETACTERVLGHICIYGIERITVSQIQWNCWNW